MERNDFSDPLRRRCFIRELVNSFFFLLLLLYGWNIVGDEIEILRNCSRQLSSFRDVNDTFVFRMDN